MKGTFGKKRVGMEEFHHCPIIHKFVVPPLSQLPLGKEGQLNKTRTES